MPARLEIFDPAMCCSTGVCGPTTDINLARVAADLEWLKGRGVAVERHNLSQDPQAFVANARVRAALEKSGVASLPIVLADGRLLTEGRYPDRASLAAALGVGTESTKAGRRRIDVELLALDLDMCDRCVGTRSSLEAALAKTCDRVRSEGIELVVHTTVVRSVEQAQALGFVSSPTIRVNGHDIALETKESPCACGESAGTCTDCRVWVHEGRDYTVAPEAMIVEAILDEVRRPSAERPHEPRAVPENIRRYLTAREGEASGCCVPRTSGPKPRVPKGRCC